MSLPGRVWRVLAHYRKTSERFDHRFAAKDRIEFDELVVGDWLHLEQMGNREWWARIGEVHLWISIPAKGAVKVRLTEGRLDT